MMNSARTRLALTYLTIIMALSIGFSFYFYHQSTNEANSGLRRQAGQLGPNLFFTNPDSLDKIRVAGQKEFNRRLRNRLIMLNIGMLTVGTVASFYLAKRSLEPLEESMAAQSRFTSDAAHEIRTPLTAMKTEIEVALRSGKLTSAEARELLNSNLEEINKLESLTSALLRLAKSSQTPVDPQALPVVELGGSFMSALSRVTAAADTKSIVLKTPKTLPYIVHGDPDQLTELFVVLLDNAIKYSPDKTQIVVTAAKSSDHVAVTIKDQGVGIKPDDLPHIFERFYRADLSRTKSVSASGYGLGLSLAESIMKAHGGVIKVSSKPDKGTTFVLEFPLV
jgi:two-component system, OmpR family, sensor histidine kinase CiaH